MSSLRAIAAFVVAIVAAVAVGHGAAWSARELGLTSELATDVIRAIVSLLTVGLVLKTARRAFGLTSSPRYNGSTFVAVFMLAVSAGTAALWIATKLDVPGDLFRHLIALMVFLLTFVGMRRAVRE